MYDTTFIDALLYAIEGEDPSKAIENTEKRAQQSVVRNQRLPKKVVVKLFSAYADKAAVNVQKNNEITKKGINSSI